MIRNEAVDVTTGIVTVEIIDVAAGSLVVEVDGVEVDRRGSNPPGK